MNPAYATADHTFTVPSTTPTPTAPPSRSSPARSPTRPRRRAPPLAAVPPGRPGRQVPRPSAGSPGWLARAVKTHRVLLLDQRGTGRSTLGHRPGRVPLPLGRRARRPPVPLPRRRDRRRRRAHTPPPALRRRAVGDTGPELRRLPHPHLPLPGPAGTAEPATSPAACRASPPPPKRSTPAPTPVCGTASTPTTPATRRRTLSCGRSPTSWTPRTSASPTATASPPAACAPSDSPSAWATASNASTGSWTRRSTRGRPQRHLPPPGRGPHRLHRQPSLYAVLQESLYGQGPPHRLGGPPRARRAPRVRGGRRSAAAHRRDDVPLDVPRHRGPAPLRGRRRPAGGARRLAAAVRPRPPGRERGPAGRDRLPRRHVRGRRALLATARSVGRRASGSPTSGSTTVCTSPAAGSCPG